MSTALMKSNTAIELSEADEIFATSDSDEAEEFEFVPSTLKVASSGARALVNENDEMVNVPITGIIIKSVKTRGMWVDDKNRIPFCSSVGGARGFVRSGVTEAGDIPQREFDKLTAYPEPHPAIPLLSEKKPLPEGGFSCATCPMGGPSAWGTGKNGRGKACAEKRALLVVPEGWTAPAILSVPTMSNKPWDAYASGVKTQHRSRYFGVITEIDVEKKENSDGQPYGQLTFKLVEKVEDPDMAKAIIHAQKEYAPILERQAVIPEEYVGENGSDDLPFDDPGPQDPPF